MYVPMIVRTDRCSTRYTVVSMPSCMSNRSSTDYVTRIGDIRFVFAIRSFFYPEYSYSDKRPEHETNIIPSSDPTLVYALETTLVH